MMGDGISRSHREQEQDDGSRRTAGAAPRMSNFRITPNALSHKLKLHQLQIFERVLARRSLSRASIP